MNRSFRYAMPLLLGALVSIQGGCDLTRFTANSTAGMFERASGDRGPIQRHFDYELVGDALPGSIMQIEGVFSVVPDNEVLGLTLMRGYLSYTFGWVEDEMQIAQDRGDMDEEERINGRARLLYERGRNIGLHLMRLRDPGIDDAMNGGHEQFVEYINSHFTSAEDVPLLFWTAYA